MLKKSDTYMGLNIAVYSHPIDSNYYQKAKNLAQDKYRRKNWPNVKKVLRVYLTESKACIGIDFIDERDTHNVTGNWVDRTASIIEFE